MNNPIEMKLRRQAAFLRVLTMLLFAGTACTNSDRKDGIQLIAHRGYSAKYPENTYLAIEEAFKRGIKYSEVDVNLTSDGVHVLFHDQPMMYRTSSGQGYIEQTTYAEIKDLDFGSWKGSQFAGVGLARVQDVVRLAERYDAYLYLDTKT